MNNWESWPESRCPVADNPHWCCPVHWGCYTEAFSLQCQGNSYENSIHLASWLLLTKAVHQVCAGHKETCMNSGLWTSLSFQLEYQLPSLEAVGDWNWPLIEHRGEGAQSSQGLFSGSHCFFSHVPPPTWPLWSAHSISHYPGFIWDWGDNTG